MKSELLKEIKKYFPKEYSTKGYTYNVKLKDLDILFNLINQYVFNNKLDRKLVEINLYEIGTNAECGQFALGKSDTEMCIINIQNLSYGNVFSKVVSVLCHEMIHMYDRYFGKMKNIIYNRNDKKNLIDVTNTNGNQFIYGYDCHGKYFREWINKFSTFGIEVKIKYSMKDKKFMKNINEGFKFFKDEFLEENEFIDDPEYKDKLQQSFNALKGCPNKDFKYIDKDHWYIRID